MVVNVESGNERQRPGASDQEPFEALYRGREQFHRLREAQRKSQQRHLERQKLEKKRPSMLSPMYRCCVDQHPCVFVPRDMVSEVGDANAALVVAQIIYRYRKGMDYSDKGRPDWIKNVDNDAWVLTSRAALSCQTGLSEDQVKRALAKLTKAGHVFRHGRSELLTPRDTERWRDLNGVRGVRVFAGMVRIAGNAAGGFILGQLDYWCRDGKDGRTRLRTYRDGHWWLAKSYEELAEELGLIARGTRSAITRLRSMGVIDTRFFRFRGRNTLHLRFDDEQFLAAWEKQEDRWWEAQEQHRRVGHVGL